MAAGQGFQLGGDLLRQLSLGLSAYRLFPGDIEQDAFVAATTRIRDAAERALAAGVTDFDLRGGVFEGVDGQQYERDAQITRLAFAGYERGIEHLHLSAVPTAEELAIVYELLSLNETEIEALSGSLEQVARARGVRALAFGALMPEAGPLGSMHLDDFTPAQLHAWHQVLDPGKFIEDVLGELGPDDADAAADGIYARLKELEDELPAGFTSRAEFLEGLERVIDALPGDIQRQFAALAFDRAEDDDLAERYLNHLTDADLARLVALVTEGDTDPFDLARRVQQVVGRQSTFIDLVGAMFQRPLPSSDELADQTRPTLSALAVSSEESPVHQSIVDLLARELRDEAGEAAAFLREAFPRGGLEERAGAVAAFRDYLVVEEPGETMARALYRWRERLRESLRARDLDGVRTLIDAVTLPDLDAVRLSLIREASREVLDGELVAEMAEWARQEGESDEVRSLLASFEGAAVDGLLDALAEEEDRGRRAMLLGMVSDLGKEHADLVSQRLDDERWYVVRNVVTILGRIGGQKALTPLVRAANHEDPTVRREVVRSLVTATGGDAVPYLARLIEDPDGNVARAAAGALTVMTAPAAAEALAARVHRADGPEEGREALDALASSPAPNAEEVLTALASRAARPRLPWGLRRYARRVLRQREVSP